jgi:hypothetical protein
MKSATSAAPHALIRLWAHHPGPARVELQYRPTPGRVVRALLSWVICWGALPFVLWIPPHYPWGAIAFVAGIYLPYRFWTGRYVVHAFAGCCPRCGYRLQLGRGSKIDLPHTLTCFHCHFEPRLVLEEEDAQVRIGHHSGECAGSWSRRWIHDESWVVCDRCDAAYPATEDALRAAALENECDQTLRRLADDGRFLA